MKNSSDSQKKYLEQSITRLNTEIGSISNQIGWTLNNVDKNKLQRQIEHKFEEIKQAESQLSQLKQESLEQVDCDQIPFTNRDAAISEITANNSPNYRLITAPKGYGKTEFLKHIQKRFQELQWCCAYASMFGNQNIEDLENELASSLNLQIQEAHELPSGERLGLLLYRNWAKWQSEGKKGIVLLIDIDGDAPHKQRLNEIFKQLKKLGATIEECLKELQFFKDNPKSLRVVIAALIFFPRRSNFTLLLGKT